MPKDGRTGRDEMVKTRLSTVPEILEHIKLQISEVEKSLERVRAKPFVPLLTLGAQEHRLEGQLEVLRAFQSMIVCSPGEISLASEVMEDLDRYIKDSNMPEKAYNLAIARAIGLEHRLLWKPETE